MLKDKVKKIISRKWKVGLVLSTLFLVFSAIFSFFNAKLISISFTEASVKALVLKDGLVSKIGVAFIDIMQNFTSFSNGNVTSFWIYTLLFFGLLNIFFILLATLHELLWGFNIAGFGKKGTSKIALEYLLALFFLGIFVTIITSIPLQAIWLAFLIMFIVSILSLVFLVKLRLFTIMEVVF